VKRFRFRLDTVLRVRRLQEEQAEGALMRAHADAREAADRVDTARETYASIVRVAGAQSFADFELTRFRHEQAAHAVGHAEDLHRGTLEIVELRRTEWADAHRRVAVLERLEDRRREEHDYEVARMEERLVEDLVATRHQRTVTR
jgi:flagellar export protein FliJ